MGADDGLKPIRSICAAAGDCAGAGLAEFARPDDDGEFSSGNVERPALRRLMADIEAGKVDCVVVYKVDRRSLLDFARMMESFEKHGVSFVSVTQQFNTSTSMGLLVLNVLLSFAQFEREIISERTRDKIAAARRKGKWSGGIPILGYDVDPDGSKLVVNEDEAIRVLLETETTGWSARREQYAKSFTKQKRPAAISRLRALTVG